MSTKPPQKANSLRRERLRLFAAAMGFLVSGLACFGVIATSETIPIWVAYLVALPLFWFAVHFRKKFRDTF